MFEHRLSSPPKDPSNDGDLYDNVDTCLDLALGQAHMLRVLDVNHPELIEDRIRLAALALERDIQDAKVILKEWYEAKSGRAQS